MKRIANRLIITSLVVLLVTSLSFSAFGEVIELDFLWLWGDDFPGTRAMRTQIEEFNNTHDHIKVVLRPTGGQTYTYREQLLVHLVAGLLPDIAMILPEWIREFKDFGVLAAFEDLKALENIDQDDYLPPAKQMLVMDGRTWGYMMFMGAPGMFYNSRMFDEAGIGAPPETWAEWESIGKRLTRDLTGDGINDVLGAWIWWPGASGLSVYARWGWWLHQAGGSYFDAATRKVTLDTPEAIRAIEFTSRSIEEGWTCGVHVSGAPRLPCGDILQDTLAMKIDYVDHLEVYELLGPDGDHILTAEMPVADGVERRGSGGGGWAFAIFDTEKKEAAAEFMEWFSRPENNARFLADRANLPATFSVLYSDEYQSFLRRTPRLLPFAQALSYETSEEVPTFPDSGTLPDIHDILATAIVRAHTPGVEPVSALQQGMELAQRRLDEAWAQAEAK